MLDRLEHRLTFLTGGAPGLPPRQRAMRETIAWSYDLLAPAEQMLFRRLAVFVGGCDMAAIEAVCTASGNVPCAATGDVPMDILDGVEALQRNSLLRLVETELASVAGQVAQGASNHDTVCSRNGSCIPELCQSHPSVHVPTGSTRPSSLGWRSRNSASC
jgi:hypothetical protein